MRAILSNVNIQELYFQLFVDVCQRLKSPSHEKSIFLQIRIFFPSNWVFAILVKLCPTQGTNVHYMQPRDFHEKMPATAEFRLSPQRGVTVQRFRNFLAVLPPPTLYKVETRKKILDTYIQHCLQGEGRVWTCVNWKTPQKCKSVPRLLSMIGEKEIGRIKAILRSFQACKSVFSGS